MTEIMTQIRLCSFQIVTLVTSRYLIRQTTSRQQHVCEINTVIVSILIILFRFSSEAVRSGMVAEISGGNQPVWMIPVP